MGQMLIADFIRTDWQSGSVSEEWFVHGNQAFREGFENLASIAARKLGCTRSENADKYWLDRVREWMQERGLDKDKNGELPPPGTVTQDGLTGTTKGLFTYDIADYSARYCMELMARGTPQSAVSPSLTENDSQRISLTYSAAPIHPKGTPKALTAIEKKKRGVIFGAIQAGDEGPKYCKTVDERKLKIPPEWIQGGCPRTYTEAYRAGQPWKKRIQDEKSRYKKKYDQTPTAEREKLLQ